MYSFEGQFRRQPKVSLRGASKQEDTSVLLQRNQEERRKREVSKHQVGPWGWGTTGDPWYSLIWFGRESVADATKQGLNFEGDPSISHKPFSAIE